MRGRRVSRRGPYSLLRRSKFIDTIVQKRALPGLLSVYVSSRADHGPPSLSVALHHPPASETVPAWCAGQHHPIPQRDERHRAMTCRPEKYSHRFGESALPRWPDTDAAETPRLPSAVIKRSPGDEPRQQPGPPTRGRKHASEASAQPCREMIARCIVETGPSLLQRAQDATRSGAEADLRPDRGREFRHTAFYVTFSGA